jgi:hypothetical protein
MKSNGLICITAGLVLLFSTNVKAQTFIPKAGMSLAKVSISEDLKELYNSPSIKYKAGFIVGVAAEFSISERISIQPELLFHQKGYTITTSETFGSATANYSETLTLNYLELPVMAKYTFGKFYANAGLFFGYGVGGSHKGEVTFGADTEKYSGKVIFESEPDNYDGDDWFVDTPFEMGIGLGGGYKLGKVMLDIRYGIGLTSIYSQKDNFDWTTKNNSIQFTVGYPLSK